MELFASPVQAGDNGAGRLSLPKSWTDHGILEQLEEIGTTFPLLQT